MAVASPWTTSYALKNDGSVAAWGYNGNGQAGVPSELKASQVVAGNLYGAALVNGSPRTIDLRLSSKVKTDQAPPSLSLVTPKPNSHNTAVTMTGTCNESSSLVHVYYKLYPIDTDPPAAQSDVAVTGTIASTAKNKWSFSANLTPQSGTNVLEVYAVDAWGNASPTVTRTFVFEVAVPLNLSIAGDGAGRVILAPASFSGPRVRLDRGARFDSLSWRDLHVDRATDGRREFFELDGRCQ